MLHFGLKTSHLKRPIQIFIASITMITPISLYAVEEVYVPGTKPGFLTGLEYLTYMNNYSTADQLRALYEGLALEALAKAAMAKKTEEEKKQDLYQRCMNTAKISHMSCLSSAASYKVEQNKPCHFLSATVGNMPHANPAGACYGRVIDQFDLYVANCNLFNAIAEADCAK